ncbi:MAG: hypothetical protein RIQ81_1451 [Pseudomonadota bacterium]|jgi:redox-sensitive bicupin YhaK (pirin superfamily)
MLNIRKSHERGHFDHGWLKTWHTFSFAQYFDRHNMSFRNIRVINEDIVAPMQGFDMHPHKDMEIITCVVSGALQHRDSLGNGAVIRPGEVQYMSAGSGILHSEVNPLSDEPCHLLQIWILPRQQGGEPTYDQRNFEIGELTRIAAPDSDPQVGSAIPIRADASLYAGKVGPLFDREIPLRNGNCWIQLIRGELDVKAQGGTCKMSPGDGLAISDEREIHVRAGTGGADFLLFDLS